MILYAFKKNIMKKKLYLLITLLLIFFQNGFSQAIDASTYVGGNSEDLLITSKMVNGDMYLLGSTQSSTFPVTNGTAYNGSQDMVYSKLDAGGNVLFSTYLGGTGVDTPIDMEVVGNEVHILGHSESSDYPVTNGSVNPTISRNEDIIYTKIDATTGTTLFSTYIGGDDADEEAYDLEVYNGEVFIVGLSRGATFTTTNGSTSNGGDDIIYIKLASNGNVAFSTYLGGSVNEDLDERKAIQVIDGDAFIFGRTASSDFPVTDGSTLVSSSDLIIVKYDTNNSIACSMLYGGNGVDRVSHLVEDNGIIYIALNIGTTFPVTNGSVHAGGSADIGLMSIDADCNVLMSTFLGSDGEDFLKDIEIHNNEIHLLVRVQLANNYPTTDGTQNVYFSVPIAYTRLDQNGNILLSTLMSRAHVGIAMDVDNSGIHILSEIVGATNFPITNGSFYNGGDDLAYTKLDYDDASVLFSTTLGGSVDEIGQDIYYNNGDIQIVGHSNSNDYPVTNTISHEGGNDIIYTRLETCPTPYTIDNTVTPSTQTVCQNGLVEQIDGEVVGVLETDLVPIYKNGVLTSQPVVEAKYQWEIAESATGPWTEIGGAIEENYTPNPVVADRYYRRVSSSSDCCGGGQITISDVASVLVDGTAAPVIEGGGIFNTCPGTSVTIGGSPTATGGGGGYAYEWAEGNSTTIISTDANPTVTPATEGAIIYTVTVTDANNCVQIDQAIVNAYEADAGETTVSYCEGTSGVQLGTTPIAGVAGVTYSWTPTAGLSCSDCAQPIATPSSNTTYTLTLTIPVTGGGSCQTTDDINVITTSQPGIEFAGDDVVICLGDTSPLGDAGVSGYSYTWAPGNYLTQNNIAQTTFQPGSLEMPALNPITYFLTAEKDGCTFVDEVDVAVIEARADEDYCGPRTVGLPDRTPNINETYAWTKVSGSGNFTGAIDEAVVPVSASPTAETIYALEVSYNGHICRDTVIVPPCGCVVNIDVEAPTGCPDFRLSSGNVKLTASAADIFSSDPSIFTYTWSPAIGLSSTTGQEVYLTDDVERTYTVTMTSPNDGSFSCSASISVNNPVWSLPTFTSPDVTVCSNVPVEIGAPTVAGYSYEWVGDGLSSNTVSNPTATVESTTEYIVTVTDDLSGCTAVDTSLVIVSSPRADAGPDHLVCDNGVVTLGSPMEANTTYSWTPVLSNWQNGTDETSAEPEVLVAINTTFTVTATNTISGCTSTDQVDVVVSALPDPFTLPDISFCPSSTDLITLGEGVPTGTGYTYEWIPQDNLINATVAPTFIVTKPQETITYTLIVRSPEGCEQFGTQTLISSQSDFTAGNNQTICVGETATLGSNSNPSTGVTYTWSPTTNLSDASSGNPTFTPTTAGSYTFTLTMDEGGCTSTREVTVQVNETVLPVIPSVTVCEGSCVQIGTTKELGVQYFWNPTTGLSDPNVSDPLACVTSTTVYTLTAIGSNGCSTTAQVTVGTNPEEAPTVTIEDEEACLGATGITFSPNITSTGNYSYTWSPNDGSLSDIYAANPEVYIQSLGAKTYTLTIVDTNTGCSTFAEVNLNVVFCELPVELASFSGRFTDCNTVQLDWTTASELNNDYFEVQHSNNGRTFNTLDIINGAGVSSENIRYQFKHLDVQSRLNYYRLKQVDFSGESEYSEIITIENNCRRFSFSDVNIYPNPVQGNIVNLELESINNQVLDITIFNLVGELVKTIPLEIGNGKIINEIDISELKSGVYFFNISSRKEQERQTYKIIKID